MDSKKVHTKYEKFLEAAKPNENGETELWLYEDLEKLYPGTEFKTKNGGDWCRDDGPLKKYIIYRYKEKNKTVGIQLKGLRKTEIEKRIRKDISISIKKQRCRVVDVSGNNIECDHKDGRYSVEKYNKLEDQKQDDFQPLLRNVNLSKRTHCKKCEETNKRYDAKRLGYSVSFIQGSIDYEGTCVGCYWYDPREFNKVVSQLYGDLNNEKKK